MDVRSLVRVGTVCRPAMFGKAMGAEIVTKGFSFSERYCTMRSG